ncbi:MAG TPA: hypothetical protein VGL56_05510 [Fimbriimonadaceae bacterium]
MKRSVVCFAPIDWKDHIARLLSAELGCHWRNNAGITVTWLTHEQAHRPQYIQSQISAVVNRIGAGEILLVGEEIKYTGAPLPSGTTVVRRIKDLDKLDLTFSQILEANGVDFLSQRADYLRGRWETRQITRDSVASWLAQFKSLGEFEWIGKGVLAGLVCYTTEELLRFVGVDAIDTYDQILYYSPDRDPLGSSTPLAHAVGKHLPLKHVERIGNNEDLPEGHSLLIEDCSISGHEFADFVHKTWPVDITEEQLLASIDLRFAVLSNLAEAAINQTLSDRDLANVTLNKNTCLSLEVATDAGVDALRRGAYYSPTGKHTVRREYIAEKLFSDHTLWGGPAQAVSARRFLRTIGEQLYRADFMRRNPGLQKSDRWFEEAGLGAGGFALTLALARSVPKSTLPVLWAAGPVKKGKKEIIWEPLLTH